MEFTLYWGWGSAINKRTMSECVSIKKKNENKEIERD